MTEEPTVLKSTCTWDLILLPSGALPITCEWVYKVKTKSDGSVERYKARLVARDFQQAYGREYGETFAPVAHMTMVRTLIVVVVVRSRTISQMDIKNALLQGDLHEEVYMQPPLGVICSHPLVLRLLHVMFVILDVLYMVSSGLLVLGSSVSVL